MGFSFDWLSHCLSAKWFIVEKRTFQTENAFIGTKFRQFVVHVQVLIVGNLHCSSYLLCSYLSSTWSMIEQQSGNTSRWSMHAGCRGGWRCLDAMLCASHESWSTQSLLIPAQQAVYFACILTSLCLSRQAISLLQSSLPTLSSCHVLIRRVLHVHACYCKLKFLSSSPVKCGPGSCYHACWRLVVKAKELGQILAGPSATLFTGSTWTAAELNPVLRSKSITFWSPSIETQTYLIDDRRLAGCSSV